MLTPVVVELTAQRARERRRKQQKARACSCAEYVPYRRRSANGTVRVATGLVGRAAQ